MNFRTASLKIPFHNFIVHDLAIPHHRLIKNVLSGITCSNHCLFPAVQYCVFEYLEKDE